MTTDRTKNMSAAFYAWQDVNASAFWLLQANKHGSRDDIQLVRDHLARAVAALDAALAPASEVEGAPV